MPNLNHTNRQPPGGLALPGRTEQPRYQRIPDFCRIYGMSRSGTYRAIAAGHLRAVKVGSATLIDCTSAENWFASLPSVQMAQGKVG